MRFLNLLSFFLILGPLTTTHAGYVQEDEFAYIDNFAAHMAASHSDGDESPLLDACRSAPSFHSGHVVTVQRTSETSNVVTSSEVQQQCHEAYLCVIPSNLTLHMTTSLHVGALQINGNLKWTDGTQSEEEIYLCAGYIVTENGGSFLMNLQSSFKQAWIYLVANGAKHPQLGWRAFGGANGATSMDITGRSMQRTWTLLDKPLGLASTTLHLLHNPHAMGWRVGDRIGVAPTEERSEGTGQTFRITEIASDGTVLLDSISLYNHKANFLPSLKDQEPLPGQTAMPPILMSAEVVNLSRNIVITGDDFQTISCDPTVTDASKGCQCTSYRQTCTVGLHTALAGTGVLRVSNTRVEKCGQRGILGKYCMHFHMLQDCPDCLLDGNAIESSQQRGIVIHGTHRTLVKRNVLWNVRGAGIYIEDGNEMYNSIEHNVAVCPFPIDDPVQHGCTLPGTDNASSDSRLNQAGFYLTSSTNDLIGNRAANSRNGMHAESGTDGAANGKVCLKQTYLGRWEGNTFHGHERFGTYPIYFYPQVTDRTLESNGLNIDKSTCNSFDANGYTHGKPTAILNHVDYDNVFVGQYDLGDVQYQGHASINNKNLIYWKETKNFEDGCSSHIVSSLYSYGNLALPDQATVIIEDTLLENVSLEANHHCKVGTTGFLCMPQYIFHNVQWKHSNPLVPWMYFQKGKTEFGGIFSLSPDYDQDSSPFPRGYQSLVSGEYKYLLAAPNNVCVSSVRLGMGMRYDNGILCKVPLRSLKVYSRGLVDNGSAPVLKMHVWFNNKQGVAAHDSKPYSTLQLFPFHQIGDNGKTNRQGYSLPVIPSSTVSYRLSLAEWDSSSRIPDDWVVEFSDPVMANRFGEEFLNLELRGRNCTNSGVVSSYHDRRFIYGGPDFLPEEAWGNHGACVDEPLMPAATCDATGQLEASECPELCADSPCNSDNSYCDCRTATCRCKAGYFGDDCSIDICADTCGSQAFCSGLYLGATLPIHNPDHECIYNKNVVPSRFLRSEEPSQQPLFPMNLEDVPFDGSVNQHGLWLLGVLALIQAAIAIF